MFRAYLIQRHFKKRELPSGDKIEEIELSLLRLRVLPKIGSADSALTAANLLYPHFKGRLCVGPVPQEI